MRLYPDLPRRRTATLAGDLVTLALLALFAVVGLEVHDRVNDLSAVGRGVQGAGRSVQASLDAAADAVQGAPLVGGQIGDALREAGRGPAGEAVALGRESERNASSLADLLGLVFFLLPALLLLSRYLPARITQIRDLTAAERVLRGIDDPARTRLLAERAAYGLPYGTLLRHTRDPLGDLAAGRLEPLLAAAREDAGLAPQRRAQRAPSA
jgi:hypothetical protein